MTSVEITRIILVASAVIVVLAAIIALIIIWIKIRKKRKEILEQQINIEKDIATREGEIKMRNREDFGEPISELQKMLVNTINHEIVEFCINSAIRNEYKKILLIGNVECYEAIAISNKADVDVFVRKNEFQFERYKKIVTQGSVVDHRVFVEKEIEQKEGFDAIMCLNSINNLKDLFLNNIHFLKHKGMFIFANTKANKKESKSLIKELENINYRFDVLNWYTGFITIVKD